MSDYSATEFQVGDRVSVEGVVEQVGAGDCKVRLNSPSSAAKVWFYNTNVTLIERPRRKLRVGSVWERSNALARSSHRYVWTGKTFVSPSGDHYARETRDLDSNPELWREVPVEELAREAGA